jgi:hypothetical protein
MQSRTSTRRSGRPGTKVVVAHSFSVARDLFALGDLLDPGGDDPRDEGSAVDLDGLLRGLVGTVRAAVASCRGLRLTVLVGGDPVVLDTLDGRSSRAGVRTSLRVPLPTAGSRTTSTLTVWAGNPGAFVDLAADLAVALGLPVGALVLDEDLPAGTGPPGSDLAAFSVVHQAVGVLIGRGHTPERAHAELVRRAATTGTTTAAVARHVVDSAVR